MGVSSVSQHRVRLWLSSNQAQKGGPSGVVGDAAGAVRVELGDDGSGRVGDDDDMVNVIWK